MRTPKIMKMMGHYLMALMAVAIFTVAGTNVANAQEQAPLQTPQQEEISDEELKKFANAANSIQKIQMKAQEEMVQKVSDSGMEIERFNEIAEAQQTQGAEVKLSEEEQKQLEAINQDLTIIQQKADEEMVAALEDEGLTIERFQQIYVKLQADPALQQRFQEVSQG